MKFEHTEDINIKRHPTSGVYYFRRGKIEVSLKTKDWTEAKLRKSLKVYEADAAGTIAFKFTVGALYNDYIADREKDLRPSSSKLLKYIFSAHLIPYFGGYKLYQINSPLWSKYCAKKRGLDLMNHRWAMTTFLKWCRRRGYMNALPDVSEIPKHKRRQRKIISANNLIEIFRHSDGALLLFISIALHNGLRRKEIMTLKWSGISFEHRYITIERDSNKLGRSRRIPVNDAVVMLLRDRWMTQKTSPWVFANARDSRRHADLSGLKTAWKTALRRSNISGITWHDFRSTFEKELNKQVEFTDTQKEKFADASMEMQKRVYVSMDHDDLRGLEHSVKISEVDRLIKEKLSTREKRGGKNV